MELSWEEKFKIYLEVIEYCKTKLKCESDGCECSQICRKCEFEYIPSDIK